MLELYIEGIELYDEIKGEFVYTKGQSLKLEHSLLSISKWESKWHEPFLHLDISKTSNEKILYYIKCMTISTNVSPETYLAIATNNKYILQIKKYIEDPHTATTIRKNNKKGPNREIVTSELIYYWMIELGIPFECEKWNLNRLMMLINVCSIKNTPAKKMSKSESIAQQKSLNALRRAKTGSRG